MSFTNQAAWLPGKGDRLKVGAAETGKPGAGKLLIKNHALGINPVDWKIQDSGHFVDKFPVIIGCDLAGEVAEVGEGVTGFEVGQRILAHPVGLATKQESENAFQLFTVVLAAATTLLPDSISYEAACGLPLALSTAAHGLYSKDHLNLPLPRNNPKKSGKTIIVWGGSSAVGAAAIQLAVASGLEVVSTASKKNHEFVKGLGATDVFDYSSSGVVEDIVKYVKDKDLVGGYEATGGAKQMGEILAKLGGGFFASTLPPPEDLPSGVTAKGVFAPAIFLAEPDIGKGIYKDFLPEALKSGQYKLAPPAKVVATGLEGVQSGMDANKKGASATKFVVTL